MVSALAATCCVRYVRCGSAACDACAAAATPGPQVGGAAATCLPPRGRSLAADASEVAVALITLAVAREYL